MENFTIKIDLCEGLMPIWNLLCEERDTAARISCRMAVQKDHFLSRDFLLLFAALDAIDSHLITLVNQKRFV